MPTMTEILSVISGFFADQGQWDTGPSDDPRGVVVRHKHMGLPCESVAHVGPGPSFVYDTSWAARATAERRGPVAELLARINATLVTGSFGLDWESGVVRLRSAIALSRAPLSEDLLLVLVPAHHQILLDWLLHVDIVIRGDMDPHEAFAEAMEQRG
jgi:Putative bacterial sensory transduction regulator